jgi:hypothetical protein
MSETSYRVIKKLSPTSRGAIKLAQRHGPALVCVRHRVDPDRRIRITTVELIVERTPIRARPDPMVGVRLFIGEVRLRAAALAEGAKWDPQHKLWRMPLGVARALGLEGRVVER